jgi:hypothetical protein
MKAILLAGLLAALPALRALAEESTTDKVKSATNKGIDKTSDGLQTAARKTKEGTQKAADKAGPALETARVKTQAGAKKALNKTSEALNKLSDKIGTEK